MIVGKENKPQASPASGGGANDLGYFATPLALTTAYPTAVAGNFAIVGSTDTVWVWDTGTVAWVDTGVTGGTYTGTAGITVGGISSGNAFVAASSQTMWNALLNPELFPTLTAPSNAFTLTEAGNHEAGDTIATLHFNATFSRGSISPQYTATSPFRSGLPNTYTYTSPSGTPITSPVASVLLSDAETVSSFVVQLGAQSWTNTVSYDAGVQPKSSTGNNYSTPLAAGTTTAKTVTITGIFPYYKGVGVQNLSGIATDGGTLTKVVAPNPFPITLSFTTSNEVPYIVYPASYGHLRKVLDVNNFDVSPDWGSQPGGPNTNITPWQTISVTNSFGVIVSCYAYQFANLTSTTASYTFSL